MSCESWNERLVARLYGESDPREDAAVERHLSECARCRDEIAGLERARAALLAAPPEVPAAPRVVVLGRKPTRFGGWTGFAAGLAAATTTFAIGLAAGQRWNAPQPEASAPIAQAVDRAELERILAAQRSELEARIAEVAAPSAPDSAGDPRLASLSRRIEDLATRTEAQRRRDLEFVLGRILAGEVQAGDLIGQTQDAVRTLAVSNDPQYVAW